MSEKKTGRAVLLWVLALLLTAAAGFYQRRTGPTWPVRGEMPGMEGERFRLVRTGSSVSGAEVTVPDPGESFTAVLSWRRWPTKDAFAELPMKRGEDGFAATLPPQPPAGKVEYYVELTGGAAKLRLPPPPTENPVLRFKGDVSPVVLIPHIACMFFAILVGLRAALGAVFLPRRLPLLTFVALGLMTLGGLVLGPLAQKAAFGEYWTGWPNGKDLTDNKVLLMWLCWVAAALAMRFLPRARSGLRRAALVLAALVMLAVYLVPHSSRGSQLDWDKLKDVRDPTEAIETG